MSALTVIYPSTPTSHFDLDYYTEKHLKLAKDIWGDHVKSLSLIKGVAAVPQGKPPYHVILNVVFNSAEAMGSAFASPGMSELAADVVNYTDVQAVSQLSEVVS